MYNPLLFLAVSFKTLILIIKTIYINNWIKQGSLNIQILHCTSWTKERQLTKVLSEGKTHMEQLVGKEFICIN